MKIEQTDFFADFANLSPSEQLSAVLDTQTAKPKKVRQKRNKAAKKAEKETPIRMTVAKFRDYQTDSLSEDDIYLYFAHWLSNTYTPETHPEIAGMWHFDRDLRLGKTQGNRIKTQAARYKILNETGFPDFQLLVPKLVIVHGIEAVKPEIRLGTEIANPKSIIHSYPPPQNTFTAGLFLEIKTVKNTPFLQDGSLSQNAHVQMQHAYHEKLRKSGFEVHFAVGLSQCQELTKNYLHGNPL